MHFEGVVRKMTTEYSSVINYFIEFENSYIHLNQFLERTFTVSGNISHAVLDGTLF